MPRGKGPKRAAGKSQRKRRGFFSGNRPATGGKGATAKRRARKHGRR